MFTGLLFEQLEGRPCFGILNLLAIKLGWRSGSLRRVALLDDLVVNQLGLVSKQRFE